MITKGLFRMAPAALLLMAAAGCYSTNIRDSWAAPDVQGPLNFEKILVVFMDPTEATRRAAEDALVRRLGADRAVASHTMFTTEQVQNAQNNQAEVRQQIQAAGVDGAVALRLVNQEQQLTYTPGMTYPTYYGGFYGYYGYGWGYAYSPGYVSTNTIVSVETNLYDVDKMVNEIADAVAQNLRQRGLLADR